MGLLRGLVRLIAYPVIKPVESARDAAAQIRADLAASKAGRERRREAVAEQLRKHAADRTDVTPEQLLNPSLITNPIRRFAVLADLHKWTAEGLAEQLVAVRRGKRFALASAAMVFCLALATFYFAPIWVVLVLAPCLFTACTLCLVSAFKYGLYQSQLEDRCLHGARDYLSRRDFVQHLMLS